DSITILGYPGIGGDTITLTRGEVSGFTSEANRGDRAFIKTSGTIAGGNSGGLAADSSGYLIGIPTQLGYGGEDQFVDCRVLADTNRDGVVDDRDNCVPTGGFINALRPINLAMPLIEAAEQGLVAINQAEPEPVPTTVAEIPAEGAVIFQDDFSTQKGSWAWEGTEGSVRYEGQELRINVTEQEYLVWGLAGENFGDVIVEVDTNVSTSTGEGDFGILCRYQDESNYYALEISEDGYFIIWKYAGGEYFALVDWTYSSAINTSAPNHLSAACVGSTYILSLNGTTLAEVTDTGDASGDAGLLVGTWDVPDFAVNFDNFVVKSPQN
ncbi:MAG: serine protease, partial [Anaerolineales bacterium]